MAARMEQSLAGSLDELRFHPTAKRIRVSLGGELICDTTSAVLNSDEPSPRGSIV